MEIEYLEASFPAVIQGYHKNIGITSYAARILVPRQGEESDGKDMSNMRKNSARCQTVIRSLNDAMTW
jgi:hypothetical protein